MNLQAHAFAIASVESILRMEKQPQFRKTTRLMLTALSSCEQSLEQLKSSTEMSFDRVGIILGTVHGELESTVSYLREYHLDKRARPFIFQNSLHQSTLGFLTMHFGLRGPSFCVSNGNQTAEGSLELAETLVHSEMCDACLVLVCDSGTGPTLPGVSRAEFARSLVLSVTKEKALGESRAALSFLRGAQ